MGIREREKNKGVKKRYRDKRKWERQGGRRTGIRESGRDKAEKGRDNRKWERQGGRDKVGEG